MGSTGDHSVRCASHQPEAMEEGSRSNSNSRANTLAVEQGEIAAILELRPFERFVYVMSVVEGYSDQACSVLLGCTRRDVIAARIRALQQIEMRSALTLIGR